MSETGLEEIDETTERIAKKREIRRAMIRRRDSLEPEEIFLKSNQIEARLFAESHFSRAKAVMFYASMRSEVRTQSMIRRALREGKRVAVPVMRLETKDLFPSWIEGLSDLEPSHFGVPEPVGDRVRPASLSEIDVIIVPGLAFDERGYRLGYGAGYYDHLLRKAKLLGDRAPYTIGICFEIQLLNFIPYYNGDMPVDLIVTENRYVPAADRGR